MAVLSFVEFKQVITVPTLPCPPDATLDAETEE